MVPKMIPLPPAASVPSTAFNGKFINMHIAGSQHAPGGDNADLRLLKIFIFKAGGPQHGPVGRAVIAIDNNGRKFSNESVMTYLYLH